MLVSSVARTHRLKVTNEVTVESDRDILIRSRQYYEVKSFRGAMDCRSSENAVCTQQLSDAVITTQYSLEARGSLPQALVSVLVQDNS